MNAGTRTALISGCAAAFLTACASNPTWNHPTADSRQFYQDEEMCIQRAERAMGNAGQAEPTNDSAAGNAGAAIGNMIGAIIGRNRAENEYERCMQSMGYVEAE